MSHWGFVSVVVAYPDGREVRHPCFSHAEAVEAACRLWRETESEFASVRIEQEGSN